MPRGAMQELSGFYNGYINPLNKVLNRGHQIQSLIYNLEEVLISNSKNWRLESTLNQFSQTWTKILWTLTSILNYVLFAAARIFP